MSGLSVEVEHKLRPLVDPLPSPRQGEWLAHHDEAAQKFAGYRSAHPIRKSDKFHIIYFCLVGDFTEPKRHVLDLTQDYRGIYFDCPVKVQRNIAPASIQAQAKGLQVEPVSFVTKLKAFCQQNGLAPESSGYKQTTAARAKGLDEERSAI